MKGQYLMTKKIILIVLALVVALGIGCRSSIVKNVHDAPMPFATENKPSIEQIKKAIIVAGSGLGWRIKSQSPGHLIGTLNLRAHKAIVDIKYSTENYSITYNEGSTNLNYDGTYIHSNYNGWIGNLEKAINVQVSSL
ncbi:uncharacterized protein METZ01_LOCUS187256 [marine metagenome]|uniref:Lipoprotein n=1 Tax=marine metagenome TaxID=408172 RepID=A0A382D8Q4_9ZZZZ